MPNSIEGKTALVTGAAGGDGPGGGQGACWPREPRWSMVDLAEKRLRELCRELGPKAVPAVFDVTDPSAIQRELARLEAVPARWTSW